MKKILALMLAGCMALSMVACGGDSKAPAADAETKTEETKKEEKTEKKNRGEKSSRNR